YAVDDILERRSPMGGREHARAQLDTDPAAATGVDAEHDGHVNGKKRRAPSAATMPQIASTTRPNQSADSVSARVSASVSAPAGVSRATHSTPRGTNPPPRVSAPRPAKTNHIRLATASTISALSVPPSSRPSAEKAAVPSAMTTAPTSKPAG